MILMVNLYVVSEVNRKEMAVCDHCHFIPVWEVRPQLSEKRKVGYACSEHIDSVLFDIRYGGEDNE